MRCEKTGDVRDREADALQIEAWGNARNVARVTSCLINNTAVFLLLPILMARAAIVEQDARDALQAAREGSLLIHFISSDYGTAESSSARDPFFKSRDVALTQRAEGKIDEVHMLVEAPVQRSQKNLTGGCQFAIKNLYCINFGSGRFFTNRSSDGGAVPKEIREQIVMAFGLYINTACNRANMRMMGVDSAVDGRYPNLAFP